MSRISSICKVISDNLDRLCITGAILLLVVNLATVMLGVFSRFYKPPIWTVDLAQVTLIWIVMLAAAPALKRGEHMSINILVDKLPKNLKKFVVTFRTLVYFAILLVMVILGTQYASKMSFFTIMSLNIKKTIPLTAIPVGMGLMIIQYTLLQFIPFENKENDSVHENNQNIGN